MPVLPPLLVRIEADASNLTTKLGAAENQIQRMSRNNTAAFDRLAVAGRVAFFGVGAAAAGLGIAGLKAASDLTETQNKVQVTFGASTAAVSAFGDEMAKRFGSSKAVMLDAVSSFGLVTNAAGFTKAESADLGTALARAADDASSLFNVPLAQALADIRSGLVGETEPVRKYGILLNETEVAAEGVRLGLIRQGEAMTAAEKVRARSSILIHGLAVAEGDHERTMGTLANRMREVQGRSINLAATYGALLLPAALKVIETGLNFGETLGNNTPLAIGLAAVIGGPLVIAMGAYIAQQVRSIALTGLQVASKLPQFFLAVGAAMQGTTAADVVLNSSMARTNATMLLGVGVIGALAGAYLFFAQSRRAADSAAAGKALAGVAGAGDAKAQLDLINKQIDVQKKKVHDLQFSFTDTLKGAVSQAELPGAKRDLRGLESAADTLKTQIKSLDGAAKATASGGLDSLGSSATDTTGALTDTTKAVDDLWSATNAYVSATDKLTADQKALQDAQGGVAQKIADQTAAARDATKANQDLRSATDALHKAQRDAPLELEQAQNDAATATDAITTKRQALTVAMEQYGRASIQAESAADDLAKSQLDATEAQRKAGDLAAQGGRTSNVVQAEQAQADARERVAMAAEAKRKADAEDPIAAIAAATATLKTDQIAILFSREKELVSLHAFNDTYDTTLTLADAFNGKLDAAVAKQEQLIIDQNTLTAAMAATAGLPQNAFVSESPTATGKAPKLTSAPGTAAPGTVSTPFQPIVGVPRSPTLGLPIIPTPPAKPASPVVVVAPAVASPFQAIPGLAPVPPPKPAAASSTTMNINVTAQTNANATEIAKEIAFIGRSRPS